MRAKGLKMRGSGVFCGRLYAGIGHFFCGRIPNASGGRGKFFFKMQKKIFLLLGEKKSGEKNPKK
jgi:hypothetical protein